MQVVLHGGRESKDGKINVNRRSLGVDMGRILRPERPAESTNPLETIMWDKWVLMRGYVWSQARSAATHLPDIPCQIVDLDQTMRTVFDSWLMKSGPQFTIENLTQETISRLKLKWSQKPLTAPPRTETVPPSLVPVYTSIRDQLQPFHLR